MNLAQREVDRFLGTVLVAAEHRSQHAQTVACRVQVRGPGTALQLVAGDLPDLEPCLQRAENQLGLDLETVGRETEVLDMAAPERADP